jgi:hypothetical protein
MFYLFSFSSSSIVSRTFAGPAPLPPLPPLPLSVLLLPLPPLLPAAATVALPAFSSTSDLLLPKQMVMIHQIKFDVMYCHSDVLLFSFFSMVLV